MLLALQPTTGQPKKHTRRLTSFLAGGADSSSLFNYTKSVSGVGPVACRWHVCPPSPGARARSCRLLVSLYYIDLHSSRTARLTASAYLPACVTAGAAAFPRGGACCTCPGPQQITHDMAHTGRMSMCRIIPPLHRSSHTRPRAPPRTLHKHTTRHRAGSVPLPAPPLAPSAHPLLLGAVSRGQL